MKHEDQTLGEATALLDAGQDGPAFEILEHLAEETDDPALRRELEGVIASGRANSRGFRKSWDRLLIAYGVGR
jgi:hypothetical protein